VTARVCVRVRERACIYVLCVGTGARACACMYYVRKYAWMLAYNSSSGEDCFSVYSKLIAVDDCLIN
jgi:hypothetical protein